jgi:hypothetical protein
MNRHILIKFQQNLLKNEVKNCILKFINLFELYLEKLGIVPTVEGLHNLTVQQEGS